MAKRFFAENNNILIQDETFILTGPEAHHINVLRHKIGDKIHVNEYLLEIVDIDKSKITCKILEKEAKDADSNLYITLYQSYIKADKMEYAVQKAVELGVNKIVPFLSKNCVVKLNDSDKLKKIERLNKISVEASKQCNRQDIVLVDSIQDIFDRDNFVSSFKNNDINILAYENSTNSLKQVLENISLNQNEKLSIGIIIGPEGGFDKTDLEVLSGLNNVKEISLGNRILKAETASLNLLSIINYVFNR